MIMPAILKSGAIEDGEIDITLSIEAGDIRRAEAGNPMNCAAARAIKRQYRVAEAVVMRSRTYINHGSKSQPAWRRYLTPESLSREIVAIDRGGHFEPGDYRITAPSQSQKLGAWRSGQSKNKRASRKTTRPYRHVTASIRES